MKQLHGSVRRHTTGAAKSSVFLLLLVSSHVLGSVCSAATGRVPRHPLSSTHDNSAGVVSYEVLLSHDENSFKNMSPVAEQEVVPVELLLAELSSDYGNQLWSDAELSSLAAQLAELDEYESPHLQFPSVSQFRRELLRCTAVASLMQRGHSSSDVLKLLDLYQVPGMDHCPLLLLRLQLLPVTRHGL